MRTWPTLSSIAANRLRTLNGSQSREGGVTMRAPRIYAATAITMALLAILSSCKSVGVGEGASDTGDVQARFTWQQTEPSSGTLSASLTGRNGSTEAYQGQFYQITSNSEIDTLGPLWH